MIYAFFLIIFSFSSIFGIGLRNPIVLGGAGKKLHKMAEGIANEQDKLIKKPKPKPIDSLPELQKSICISQEDQIENVIRGNFTNKNIKVVIYPARKKIELNEKKCCIDIGLIEKWWEKCPDPLTIQKIGAVKTIERQESPVVYLESPQVAFHVASIKMQTQPEENNETVVKKLIGDINQLLLQQTGLKDCYIDPSSVKQKLQEKCNQLQVAMPAQFQLQTYYDTSGYTLLHNAAYRNHPEFVEFWATRLKLPVNVFLNTESRQTPLHIAARRGHVSVIENLYRHGADLNAQDNEGNTALHIAVQNNNAEVIRALLSDCAGVDEHAVAKNRQTAFEQFICSTDEKGTDDKIIELFLSKNKCKKNKNNNIAKFLNSAITTPRAKKLRKLGVPDADKENTLLGSFNKIEKPKGDPAAKVSDHKNCIDTSVGYFDKMPSNGNSNTEPYPENANLKPSLVEEGLIALNMGWNLLKEKFASKED